MKDHKPNLAAHEDTKSLSIVLFMEGEPDIFAMEKIVQFVQLPADHASSYSRPTHKINN